jgi:drug/metabolite transporter (DMT)-like permease
MPTGVMAALGAAVLFGVSTPLAKMLVGTVPPLLLAGLLYAGSGLGLLLVLIARRLRPRHGGSITLPRRGEWFWLLGAILFGGIAGPVALTYGLARSEASTASLMLNLEAVLTAMLAWFLFCENFERRVLWGMLCIVAGGVLLAWAPGRHGEGSLGLAFVTLACLCWAVDNNLTRRVSENDAVFVATAKGLVAGAVNLGLALILGQALPAPGVAGLALAVGFLGYGVSLVLFVLALRHLGAARTGAYFSVAPFFGAALAVALQGDVVTIQLLAAGLLMAAGVWLHLAERHVHSHAHGLQEHAHMHSHDEHHRHAHAFPWDGREPHSHAHSHPPLVHSHAHYPDVHHRHPH